jgi:hypothetical protein
MVSMCNEQQHLSFLLSHLHRCQWCLCATTMSSAKQQGIEVTAMLQHPRLFDLLAFKSYVRKSIDEKWAFNFLQSFGLSALVGFLLCLRLIFRATLPHLCRSSRTKLGFLLCLQIEPDPLPLLWKHILFFTRENQLLFSVSE